jgi:FMN phosphatase YigB (HAD superfamily)
VIGMLEAGYNIWKVQRRSGEAAEEGDLAPPYKEMIASACNLQMLRDQREGSKKKLTREELKAKIIEGDVGITRLWHDHMGTSFLKPDSALAGKIRGLQEAGVEVAILTHSCRRGQGGAIAKVKELGLADLIPERYVFGLEELAPHKKGKHPEAFEHVLAAVNHMLHKAEPILPPETVMGDDTIGNLRGARKAGMETVWVRGTNHELPAHPSRKMEEKLACVDHIYATPYQFLDALMASMNAAKAAGPEVKEQGQGRTTVEQGGGPR